MRIPSIEQCYLLMDKYGMLDNIRAHSVMVTRVADVLLAGLVKSPKVNGSLPLSDLVRAGALLHDIAKTQCLKSRCDHARQGRDICLEHGYQEVAEVVREHVVLAEFSPERYQRGHFLAKEIVYYADKRVRHDEIVTLEERLDYILEHYGNNDPARHSMIMENFDKCKLLENYILSTVDMGPEALTELVDRSPAKIAFKRPSTI